MFPPYLHDEKPKSRDTDLCVQEPVGAPEMGGREGVPQRFGVSFIATVHMLPVPNHGPTQTKPNPSRTRTEKRTVYVNSHPAAHP